MCMVTVLAVVCDIVFPIAWRGFLCRDEIT